MLWVKPKRFRLQILRMLSSSSAAKKPETNHIEASTACNVCKQPIQVNWNFCPNCGNTLRIKPLPTSVLKQLLIYAVSFFLPPFGLGYAFKYLRQNDRKTRIIGMVSIILTILSGVAII